MNFTEIYTWVSEKLSYTQMQKRNEILIHKIENQRAQNCIECITDLKSDTVNDTETNLQKTVSEMSLPFVYKVYKVNVRKEIAYV